MLRVLDYFRHLYKKETQKDYYNTFEFPPQVLLPSSIPSWEYVCWLEHRLSKYESEELLTTKAVITATNTEEFVTIYADTNTLFG